VSDRGCPLGTVAAPSLWHGRGTPGGPSPSSRSLLTGRVSVGVVDLVDSEVRAAGRQRADCPGMSPARHASDDQLDAATWCRHLVPHGSVYAFLADHRHELFPPGLFADLDPMPGIEGVWDGHRAGGSSGSCGRA